ncbi:aspartate dehydrogenase domain-containing protein [Gulosibacter chungangensis]|uniref:L-aspartate dehydrogenase n=1 Tax=Gulosibacter chungangensis TaxID=979746 RepID=A0A7J5BF46_9MICO|nr:aspartate dehydrogenase domain-containing protein [Gulosibacter chungangensis]KAB1644886.1 DUF108 domain-containing protein [Gulosibacter chungangensis]
MADILLIGYGTIGQDLVSLLEPEIARGEIRILAAAVRDPQKPRPTASAVPLIHTDKLANYLPQADLVVECAGVPAAISHGSEVISAGREMILTSVGALAHRDARLGMLSGPGKLTVTNGAIGGFDLLGAAAQAGGIAEISIQTSKLAASLVRPWMTQAERARLQDLTPTDEAFVLFDGNPTDAIEKFPANVNVAVALAWATRELLPADAPGAEQSQAFERALAQVRVRILADPNARLSLHVIRASGPAGTYEFSLENAPSPSNPRTSGLTAMSVARDVRESILRC